MTARELFHQQLNSRRDPERAYRLLSALAAIASAADCTPECPAKLPARLNACKNPNEAYDAAMTLVPMIRETVQQRRAQQKGGVEA